MRGLRLLSEVVKAVVRAMTGKMLPRLWLVVMAADVSNTVASTQEVEVVLLDSCDIGDD